MRLVSGTLLYALLATTAFAEPLAVPRPLLTEAPGAETVTLGGTTIVNSGLVGIGRVPATMIDPKGDSLGSFSSMAIDPKSWARTAEGYAARLLSLPDRGYNDPDKGFFSDYQGRILAFDMTFKPAADAATAAPITLKLNAEKSLYLTDLDGKPTTGADPAANTVKQGDYTLPVPPAGELGAGRMSLDAESLVVNADGTFYVGDEYAAGIYHFGTDGRLKGMIAPGPAEVPVTKGAINYNSLKEPNTGRRNNQGMEGMSVTPDGKTMIAVMQSAVLQDSSASNDQTNRAVTRIFVYDLTANALPKAPKAVYALELPIYSKKGDGKVDRTAAQSELVALDDHRFLMLARDGTGYGCGCKDPIVIKAIMLVDTTGATNLAGTDYETTTKPIAPAKDGKNVLDPAIIPAKSAVAVNMLNPVQLARFGVNLDQAKPTATTMSEKWEAMALVPALDAAAPNDAFLFVGNDNDFLTTKGVMQGKTYDAGLDNDTVVLAYRLTLPADIATSLTQQYSAK